MKDLIPTEQIERAIFLIRGHKVMLDADLARLYGVTVGRLNEAVKRNIKKFPSDFMFQLTFQELRGLRSQIAISKKGRGGRRYAPYAFTEHGAIMAANVLNSRRAVQMSVYVVRAFVKLRTILGTHKELDKKLAELERRMDSHDTHIQSLLEAIRRLMAPEPPIPAASASAPRQGDRLLFPHHRKSCLSPFLTCAAA